LEAPIHPYFLSNWIVRYSRTCLVLQNMTIILQVCGPLRTQVPKLRSSLIPQSAHWCRLFKVLDRLWDNWQRHVIGHYWLRCESDLTPTFFSSRVCLIKIFLYLLNIIVTCINDSRRSFELVIRFIGHIQVVTRINCNTIANFHTLQITTAHPKTFQSSFTSRFLATDLNNGDFSTASINSSLHTLPYNWLTTQSVTTD
jgi:hypothetical protein